MTYTYDASTVIDGGTAFTDGDLVEVRLDGTGKATKISLEDVKDAQFEPAEGQELSIEGFVSGFTAHPGDFLVGEQAVRTTANTKFEGGISADLIDGKKVEAEGHISSGALVADKISFDSSILIEANAGSKGSADMLGKDIQVTSLTEFEGIIGESGIASGDGLRIEGFMNTDGVTITATKIKKLGSPVASDKVILQGVVASFTGSFELVIAGITVDYAAAADVEDASGNPITLAQFLALLSANTTVVKAQGTFSPGTLTAKSIEID